MPYEILGLVFAVLVQAAASVWWAATLHGKVVALEGRIGGIEKDQRQQDMALAEIKASLARLDERSAQMVEFMNRLEKRLGQVGA